MLKKNEILQFIVEEFWVKSAKSSQEGHFLEKQINFLFLMSWNWNKKLRLVRQNVSWTGSTVDVIAQRLFRQTEVRRCRRRRRRCFHLRRCRFDGVGDRETPAAVGHPCHRSRRRPGWEPGPLRFAGFGWDRDQPGRRWNSSGAGDVTTRPRLELDGGSGSLVPVPGWPEGQSGHLLPDAPDPGDPEENTELPKPLLEVLADPVVHSVAQKCLVFPFVEKHLGSSIGNSLSLLASTYRVSTNYWT